MKTKFSERLQYLIDIKKISQKDVALGIKVNEARISDWINENVKQPRRTTLQKLSDFFGCHLNWLANGEGDPFSKVEMARIGAKILSGQLEIPDIDDDDVAYLYPPSGDPLGIESMATENEEAIASHIAEQERRSEEEAFRQRAAGRLSLFLDWIKDEFGTDSIAIEQGFLALESGCEEFKQWKEQQLKKRTKEKNKTGTDN